VLERAKAGIIRAILPAAGGCNRVIEQIVRDDGRGAQVAAGTHSR
jgi:hypothetical protein